MPGNGNAEIRAKIILDGEAEFKRAITDASAGLKTLGSESKLVDEKFKGQANSLDALRAKHDVLSRSLEQQKQKQQAINNALTNAQENYKKVGNGLNELKDRLEKAKKGLEEMKDSASTDEIRKQEEEIEELTKAIQLGEQNYSKCGKSIQRYQQQLNSAQAEGIRMGRELDDVSKYLNEAENSADHCASSIDNMGKKVKNATDDINDAGQSTSTFGDMLKANLSADVIVDGLKAVGEAALEAAKYVLDVGSSFEAAMSEVSAISGATGSDFDALSEKAKELGASTKFSATEAANAFKYMSLAGWDTQSMLEGIDGIMDLAAASGMELADASDMVTDYLSAFGMQAAESAKMADMLSFAQSHSNTTVEQLGDAYGNCAANMHAAGQDIETTTSILEAFANQGIKGSEAGTKLSAIMRDITAKMDDGKIAIGDVAVAVTDSEGNFRDLTEILSDVEAATAGMGDADRAAALSATFTSRSVGGLNMILTEGTGKIAGYENALRNAGGAAKEAAAVMQDNLKGDITTLNSALEGLGIAAYDYIDGPVRGVVQGLTGMISGLTDILERLHDIISPNADEAEELAGSVGQFTDEIVAANDQVSDLLSKSKEALSGADLDTSQLEAYKEQLLEINSAEEKSEYQKYQLESIVQALSGSVPGLSAAFDAEAGSLNLTNEEISDMIEHQEALVQLQAALGAKQNVYAAMTAAQSNAAKATDAVAVAQEELNAYTDEYGDKVKLMQEGNPFAQWMDPTVKKYYELTEAVQTATEEQDRANAQYDEAKDQYDQLVDSLEELRESGMITADEEAEMAEALGISTDAFGENAEAAGENAEALADESEAALETAENVKTGAETQVEAMNNVMEAFRSAKEEAASGIKVDFFSDTFNGGIDETVETLLENSETQLEGLRNYAQNLQTVSQHVGKEIAPEFMQYLQSLGTDGANVLQHICDTFEQDNGAELIQEWSDNYVEKLQIEDEITDAMAASKVALEMGLGELGSTDADFDGLRQAIDSAFTGLDDEMASQLAEAVNTAQLYGVQIPEGLAEGIASGEISPQQAIEQLNGALQGSFDGLVRVAQELGLEIPPEIAAGITAGDTASIATALNSIINAIAQGADKEVLAGAMDEAASEMPQAIENHAPEAEAAGEAVADSASTGLNKTEGASEAGKTTGENYVTGVESAKSTSQQAGTTLGEAVTTGVKSKTNAIKQAGTDSAKGYVDAINSAKSSAQSAGAALGEAALSGINNYKNSFYSVGVEIASGLASGISSGGSSAISAAASVAAQALQAAKNTLGIHSPSRVFREEVGQKIGEGMAFGIADRASMASQQAELMSVKIYNKATAWMLSYKNAHQTSLEDEKYYWEQVSAHVKEGSAAFVAAQKKIAEINEGILGDELRSFISNNFGVSSVTEKGEQKSIEDYNSELISAAKKTLSNYQIIHETTLEQEEQFWLAMVARTQQGSQGWYDAMKELKEVREAELKAEQNAQEEILKAEQDVYDKAIERAEKLTKRRNIKTDSNVDKSIQTSVKNLQTWMNTLDKMKPYSDEWYEVRDNINGAQDDVVSATERFIENQKSLGNMSAQQELKRWKKTLKYLEEGTQAWYDAKAHIHELNVEIRNERKEAAEEAAKAVEEAAKREEEAAEAIKEAGEKAAEAERERIRQEQETAEAIKRAGEEAAQAEQELIDKEKQAAQDRLSTLKSVQSKILSQYKTYFHVSAKAEMEYWDIARQQFQEGTAERIEADQQYFDAKESYYDQLNELDEDYAEKKKEIDEELNDSVENLQKTYDDAVKSRKNEILSSFNLFEDWDAEGWDSDTLMKNMKHQVEGMEFWQAQLDELGNKGLSDAFMDELKAMGPEAAANLWSLNQMTAEQLDEYQRMWERKNELAQKQAEEDNEDLLASTQQSIEDARKQAMDELQKLEADYRSSVAELSEGLSDGLRSLVSNAQQIGEDMVSALITCVKNGVTDVTNEIGRLKAQADAAKAAEEARVQAARQAAEAAEKQRQAEEAAENARVEAARKKAEEEERQRQEEEKRKQQEEEKKRQQAAAEEKARQQQQQQEKAEKKQRESILSLIKSGKKRSKTVTDEERSTHSGLWVYLTENYGYAPSEEIIKAIGEILGISSKGLEKMDGEQKRNLMNLLKQKGYATGTRKIANNELAWILENQKTEYIVRQSDNAVLQPMRAGDKVINARGADNLYDFANNPQEFLTPYVNSAIGQMYQQEHALQQHASTMDTSGISALNRLTENYPAPVINVDNTGMVSVMEQLLSGLGDVITQMGVLGNRQIVMDTGEVVGALRDPMSRANATVQVRRNRGRF